MGSPNIIAAGALARPSLSAEATSLLRRLACMPPGWSRAELSALLEAEGLVGFDAAFEVEARFGGLTFEKGRVQARYLCHDSRRDETRAGAMTTRDSPEASVTVSSAVPIRAL